MFDVGFSELVLCAIVALVVIGPERLPRLARTVGLWVGKARYFVGTVKADIDRELHAEELKRVLREQAQSTAIHEIIEETRSTVQAGREQLNDARTNMESAAQPATGEPTHSQPSGTDASLAKPHE